jgi:hypothetical protein
MATATTKGRSNRGATSVSMEFLIVKDNGGDFHWTLLDRDGYSLGRSPSFVWYEHAEAVARVVLAGAGSARLDRRAAISGSLDIPETNLPITAAKADGAEGRFKEATGAHPATPACKSPIASINQRARSTRRSERSSIASRPLAETAASRLDPRSSRSATSSHRSLSLLLRTPCRRTRSATRRAADLADRFEPSDERHPIPSAGFRFGAFERPPK